MDILLIGLLILVFMFGSVVLVGAPYLPTKSEQIKQALDLLSLKKSDVLFELGAGAGAITVAVARKGVRVEAYEINPLLVLILYLRTMRYRKYVGVHLGNMWSADLSLASHVYVFLQDRFMKRLDQKLTEQASRPVKLVSYAFKVPGKKVVRENGPMYLYQY